MSNNRRMQKGEAPLKSQFICNIFFTLITITLLVLSLYFGLDGHKAEPEYDKPFGLGLGPAHAFYAGSSLKLSDESLKLVKDLTTWNYNYKKLSKSFGQEDQDFIDLWASQDQCIGGCMEMTLCIDGYCFCDYNQEQIPVFGKCWSRSSGFLKEVDDTSRWRKPPVPPLPDDCYKEVKKRDKKGELKTHTIIDPAKEGTERCTKKVFPNEFDHTNLTCGRSDHRHCQEFDRNMFCSKEGKCMCREGMEFNTDTEEMECQLHLSVDCSEETPFDFVDGDEGEILETITGEKPIDESKTYDEAKTRKVFCVHLDKVSSKYNEYHEEELVPRIMGLNLIGFGIFIVFCMLLLFTACNWYRIISLCIRYSNPANILQDMDEQSKMAAMGAMAGREYLDQRAEQGDQMRMAQMQGQQGGYPVQ